eukprot:TRINITY_DN29435_c0_g1_i1.p1 TRINITY_DN29435_c0_g1~~TRINITY_DN29435_c0_g1_i1.p1  ORF type:complete len:354 (-),score=57.18 TRINITY_DN29435_c0_g1_i1:261-1322(-)
MLQRICRIACARSSCEVVDGRRVLVGELLADGGFAYVYAGSDAESGEKLAIRKVLLQDETARQAAFDEIALLEALPPHEHLVRFFGAEVIAQASSASYVSLFELCKGGTLVKLLETAMSRSCVGTGSFVCPCLPETEVLDVLGSTASALGHLHANAIVHYDVKSENLLLSCAGGVWKLCDFGSASRRTFDLTDAPRRLLLEAEEFVSGRLTPIYRPPEAADVYLRWTIGSKVDVFALGCVLYATLTGAHPFPMDSALANVQAKVTIPAEMLSAYPRTPFATWVSWLLQRRPQDRPTAQEVAAAVARFRGGDRSCDVSSPSASLSMSAGSPKPRPLLDGWEADFSAAPKLKFGQ